MVYQAVRQSIDLNRPALGCNLQTVETRRQAVKQIDRTPGAVPFAACYGYYRVTSPLVGHPKLFEVGELGEIKCVLKLIGF